MKCRYRVLEGISTYSLWTVRCTLLARFIVLILFDLKTFLICPFYQQTFRDDSTKYYVLQSILQSKFCKLKKEREISSSIATIFEITYSFNLTAKKEARAHIMSWSSCSYSTRNITYYMFILQIGT